MLSHDCDHLVIEKHIIGVEISKLVNQLLSIDKNDFYQISVVKDQIKDLQNKINNLYSSNSQ